MNHFPTTINDILDVHNEEPVDLHQYHSDWSIHEYDGMPRPMKILYPNGEIAYMEGGK